MTDWVLVTGASRGIGRAIAEAVAADGHTMVVNYHSKAEAAAEVVAAIAGGGGTAEAIGFDVADRPAAKRACQDLLERLGTPYGVVHNAGITRDGLLAAMDGADWDRVVATNLTGFFNVVQPFLKDMLSARRGRIVAISSASGQVGNPGQVNYAASKAGLHGAVRSLAKEVARRGITVNAVAPGPVATEMLAGAPVDKLLAAVPAGRLGRPEEVGALVRYLLGDDAGYVTGQVIGINGGIC